MDYVVLMEMIKNIFLKGQPRYMDIWSVQREIWEEIKIYIFERTKYISCHEQHPNYNLVALDKHIYFYPIY